MQIGMMNNPRFPLREEIAFARKHGFDFLDLTLEPSATHPSQVPVAEIRRALGDAGLGVIGHTAYYLPLASPYESLRQAALMEIRLALEVLAGLGADKMTAHPDRSISFVLGSKGVLQKNLQSLREIEREAGAMGIQLLIENMDRTFHTPEQLREALSQLPEAGFHLDVGHANLEGGRNRSEELLQEFFQRLAHVHLSDNFGREDLHLPLGAGNIDWERVIAKLKGVGYDGTITLEVFSLDRRYLIFSRNKLREMWGA